MIYVSLVPAENSLHSALKTSITTVSFPFFLNKLLIYCLFKFWSKEFMGALIVTFNFLSGALLFVHLQMLQN